VLDTADGRVVRAFGRRGQGPEEFDDPLAIGASSEHGRAVWVSDNRVALTLIEPTSGLSTSADTVAWIRVTSPRARGVIMRPFGPGRFLGYTDHMGDSGFIMVDARGRVVGAGTVEFPGDSSLPYRVRSASTNGSGWCAHPAGRGFALHFPGAGRIELFGRNAERLGLAQVPYPSEEIFRMDRRTREPRHSPDREYYKDCKYSDELLFALFKGRRIADNIPKDPASGSRFVHVFDLEGRLLRVLHLDRPVTNIEPSRAGTTLYAFSGDAGAVYRFRLPGSGHR
jgi:hypothetical protein